MTVSADERVSRLLARLRAHAPVGRRPASTYRLQLSPEFDFRAAAAVVPYLDELGVSELYLSPILQSSAGSTHGYDVVAHDRLRAELGGDEAFAELSRAAVEHGLGLLVDLVPNHMGIGPENAWWEDVLENGPSSVYAHHFDVDWHPVKDELENKILVPVLGDQYGAVLERGELRLVREGGAFWLCYFEHRFPISPRSVPRILLRDVDSLRAELGESDVNLQELLSIVTALEKLAPRAEPDAERVTERAREKEVAKRRLAQLVEASPRIGRYLDDAVAAFNGTPDNPASFDALDALLDGQAYRLAHWRVAGEEINYRRFFDIDSLAAIRMEDERVFEATHRLTFALVRAGAIAGLRVDHPDGLYAPVAYFRALQQAFLVEAARALWEDEGGGERELAEFLPELRARVAAAHESGELPARPLYVVVEKILEGRERMPRAWCVDGTTGYDFLGCANALYVDRAARSAFDALYARFTGAPHDFRRVVYEQKKMLMAASMASELNVLARRLNRISEGDRRTRDFTLGALGGALREYIANLPIYRTYVEGTEPGEVDERDQKYIMRTLDRASRRSRNLNPSLFRFLGDVLLLRHHADRPLEERRPILEFVRKLQQVTGAVTAKAIEDTAYYVFNRLVSLAEVGSDPDEFGVSVEDFHALCRARRADWPGSLNATSTHDTKRSEDVRLRICALSEIPDEWAARVTHWANLNSGSKAHTEDQIAPDANDELFLYQTLIGAFPDEGAADERFRARLAAYLEKALREAKTHTSWTNVDESYEGAMQRFASQLLSSKPFLDDFVPFQRRVARAARWSSLSQVALKLAAPGVTDVYQGCELWDLSLVDPDNRRPVDFARRARLLREIGQKLDEGAGARARLAAQLGSKLEDGRAKLLLLREGLRWRRREPELLRDGEYLPLTATGEHASHLIAFARRAGERAAICVAPRLVMKLLDEGGGAIAWSAEVTLPSALAGRYTDVVTGRAVDARRGPLAAAELLAGFPVALLRRD